MIENSECNVTLKSVKSVQFFFVFLLCTNAFCRLVTAAITATVNEVTWLSLKVREVSYAGMKLYVPELQVHVCASV